MEKISRIERPWPIILICLIAFLGAAVSLIMLINSFLRDSVNPGEMVNYGVGFLLLIPFFNIYRMKKSGYYLYAIFFVAAQSNSIISGTWKPVGLIMPAFLSIAFIYYFKELD